MPAPEHVGRRSLALPFCDDPVLDAYRSAAVRIWPACDVAGGIDSGDIRLQVFVDDNAVVDGNPGAGRKRDVRLHANTCNNEVSGQAFAVLQNDCALLDRRRRGSEMEDDAVVLVDRFDHVAEFRPDTALKPALLWSNSVNLH